MPEGTDTAAGGNPAIPEGWQIVPIEPTEDMLETVRHAYWPDISSDDITSIYAAMLAAVPAPALKIEDANLNLAKALFEATYGMRLRMWSDETRDFWLARASQALDPGDLGPARGALLAARKALEPLCRAPVLDGPGGRHSDARNATFQIDAILKDGAP
jgi:hypothetical protein